MIAELRDGSPVGAWVLKAHPDVWDIGTALAQKLELNWWRLAPTYRAELVERGHPCVLWVTRGDERTPSGIWAVGEISGDVLDDVGDPDDELWIDQVARRQVRPRVPVSLDVLPAPILVEQLRADPRTASMELFRVPRMGNPASLSPDEWSAVNDLAGWT